MTANASRPAWQDREGWLSLREEVFDPATIGRLERIGVGPDWHALDVGAGGGSIAAWLARRVGPGGRVVASDIDTSLLARMSEPNLEVLVHDVQSDDFPAESFDLVHCRAVLVHLPQQDEVLARIVHWLKPGGVLLAEEPWIEVGLLSPDPGVVRAVQELRAGGIDCGFARRLPTALEAAGLERIDAEGDLTFFHGATPRASFFRKAIEGACVPIVAGNPDIRAMLARTRERFDDPSWCDCGWPRIAAWGRKPSTAGLE